MADNRVPAIPDPRFSKTEDVLAALKEWVEVRGGARGDALDRAVTLRDLINSGMADAETINGMVDGPPPIPLNPGTTDPATPPTPTALTANGALFNILLSWEFARGYSRLSHFEVWRSETDALGDAVMIAHAEAAMYSDPVPPESTYFYWVRAVSDAGVSPYNAVEGTRGQTPFFLQEEDTVVNGVPVQAGAYFSAAWIMNGVITNAKIGNLAVDNAKISDLSVTKLTAGKLQVGAYIESTNYLSGDTGWHIAANGNAEFSNVTVRGTVYATAGSIGGNIINSSGLQSPNYNGTTAGWRIDSSGNVVFNQGTFRGALSAATGTFEGALSAATGTFVGDVKGGQFMTGGYTGYAWPPSGQVGSYIGPSGLLLGNGNDGRYFQVEAGGNIYAPGFSVVNGTLTINQANVIDTLQIAGNAVTVPVSYTGTLVDQTINLNLPQPATISVMAAGTVGVVRTGFSFDTIMYIYIDGVEVASFTVRSIQTGNTGGDPDLPIYEMVAPLAGTASRFVVAGTRPVRVRMTTSGGDPGSGYLSFVAIACKR